MSRGQEVHGNFLDCRNIEFLAEYEIISFNISDDFFLDEKKKKRLIVNDMGDDR